MRIVGKHVARIVGTDAPTGWMIAEIGVTSYASASQVDGTMTRMIVGVIAAIGASGCGSGSRADGTMTRTGACAAACVIASRRDATGAAMSSPEASGTRTTRLPLSFAGGFAVTSLGSIFQNGGVT